MLDANQVQGRKFRHKKNGSIALPFLLLHGYYMELYKYYTATAMLIHSEESEKPQVRRLRGWVLHKL